MHRPAKSILLEYLQDHTNQEAAAYFKANVRTIQRWRDFYSLSREYVVTKGSTLTPFQLDLLTGLLLSDGHLTPISTGGTSRFEFKQTRRRKEFVQFVYGALKPFAIGKVLDNETAAATKVNGKWTHEQKDESRQYYSSEMYTLWSKEFSPIRKMWYCQDKKVPDLVLNWRIVAFWFAGDGYNRIGGSREITLATHSFDPDDLAKLKLQLHGLGVDSSIYQSGVMAIPARSHNHFISNVKPHIQDIRCLKYKLQSAARCC